MKKSQDYYLKSLAEIIEDVREGKTIHMSNFSKDTARGLLAVFNVYLFHKWIEIGDTAFNRSGYRNATDYLFEQLENYS